MSCLSALHLQIATFVSVPHEILLLQHEVLREYARILVGPDFVHTMPSVLILAAVLIVLWRNPPSSTWLAEMVGSAGLYKTLQVVASWVTVNTVMWFWLIIQRLLYCYVWTYWSYESEYRVVSYQWWQRVWSSYYPPPLQPPVMSASLISWILSMSLSGIAFGCAVSVSGVQNFAEDSILRLKKSLTTVRCSVNLQLQRAQDIFLANGKCPPEPEEADLVPNEAHSDISTQASKQIRREVRPISYGTNWVPKPSFQEPNDAHRKSSMKSLHTIACVQEVPEATDKLSPRQIRQRRGCHTVIPCNSSDRSSEC